MMTPIETRTALSLALVYMTRMLGLFIIIPVLSLYLDEFPNSTPFLLGLAIGVYGLTQAIFQIPLGLLSDKIGRKPVIIGGLCVFSLGSMVAALGADNLYFIIAGRLLQGMGAIAASTMALAADLTSEANRPKVMATIGMSIGLAFLIAMICAPILDLAIGLSGLFWLTASLAILAIFIVLLLVPTPEQTLQHADAGIIEDYLRPALTHKKLAYMNMGAFLLHMMMTANFVVVPLVVVNDFGLPQPDHWQLYAPVFILSFVLIVPFIILAAKKQKIKQLLLTSIACLVLAQVILALYPLHISLFVIGFFLFFVGFNFLEAMQPSLVAKLAPKEAKGTAMGLFTTAQFLGIFTGGLLGGLLFQVTGVESVFLLGGVMGVVWLILVWGVVLD